MKKTLALRPEAASRIGLQDTERTVRAFLDTVNQRVLDAYTLDPTLAEEYVREGDATVAALMAMQQRLNLLLDELLLERIGALQQRVLLYSALIGALVLLAAYFAYGFYRVTRGGTELVQHHLRLMAEGDLREVPPQPWGRDEPARIIVDLQQAYQSLHQLIRRVRLGARDLSSASAEIAHASRNLGARTEAAAANLEQQASAMEQIGSQVGSTAQRAGEAAEFSQRNAALAADSRGVVQDVVGTMRDIQSSRQKIAAIIQVIDGIAF